MFYICKISETGEVQGLRSTHDEEYADEIVDYYCELWPHAYIDVLNSQEYDEAVGRQGTDY